MDGDDLQKVADLTDEEVVDGELVGGIFYFNYPSGAGFVSGAVFGRSPAPRPRVRARSKPSRSSLMRRSP